MSKRILFSLFYVSLLSTLSISILGQNAAVIGNTYATSTEYWPARNSAPTNAPNVIWIVLDDVGYGASSAFGGLIPTPTFDSLANSGLRYTNFHTTSICAPTRASLLTGRNSSRVHEAGFSHAATAFGFPGWDGRIPNDKGTIAQILKNNGYSTFAVGKWGLTPDEDTSGAGPFDYWPTGKGFDQFFGFLFSQDDQYKTKLVEGNRYVKPDGRHFSAQITDKAIEYIDIQKKSAPNKPFFLYYSPGATHAPHQVPEEWRNIYKGQFDRGWDWYREAVFQEQKKLKSIPQDAILPERNPHIAAWDKLSPDEKRLYARFFEVYAAYLTYTDYEIGRLLTHLKSENILDNTLIVLLLGDNGASKEGSDNGDIDEPIFGLKGIESSRLVHNLANIDKIGTPEGTEVNYPLGWAQATNTPFKFWKSDAHSEGGTHNPLIINLPKRISQRGVRNQYAHVIDVLPTTLDVIGLTPPKLLNGELQDTIQGVSLDYTFANPHIATRHIQQYYYIFGSRAMYKDGWKASFAYEPKSNVLFNNYSVENLGKEEWKLYNLDKDFNERIDLSKKYPEKLEELKSLFDEEAKRNNLYPLINWDDVIRKGLELKIKKAAKTGK